MTERENITSEFDNWSHNDLVAEVKRLREVATKAAEQFEFYAEEHRKKMRASQFNGLQASANLSREKALESAQHAAMCRSALPSSTA